MQDPMQIAIQHHQAGRLQEAGRIYQSVLARNPNDSEALHLLGVVAHQLGQHQPAAQLMSRAIVIKPSPAYYANLAEVWRALGQLDTAVECCRTALALSPAHPEAANHLGLALMQQGKLAEAIEQFRAALMVRPNFAIVHTNLANALRTQGELESAIKHYRTAIECDPNLASAHDNLGQLLRKSQELPEALEHCRKAIELRPGFAAPHFNLGNVLIMVGNLDEARRHFVEALRLNPSFAEAHNNLGNVLIMVGNPDEARRHFVEALRLNPSLVMAHDNLGSLRVKLNDLKGAEESFRTSLRYDPNGVRAWEKLAQLLRSTLPEDDLEAMRRLVAKPALPKDRRASLHFGLAQVFDARKQYAEAAEHLHHANALTLEVWRERGENYDPVKHSGFVNEMIATCTPAFFHRLRGLGLDSELPIFIIGLPRSGTTLIEQILASHSQVFGGGELPFTRGDYKSLPEVMRSLELEKPTRGDLAVAYLSRLGSEAIHTVAQRHLARLRALNPTAQRIADKEPENYMFLGLLAVLFPKAKFIHCRRDLRDVAVSCWMTNFGRTRWANDPEHIGSRFHEYRRLMDHWRTTLPVPLLHIDYEETVADLESVARKLVSWCELEWEPACLEFHRTQRPINAASVTQVRQPIYTHSVGRWKNYEPALGNLFTKVVGENAVRVE
jgi:tetratricopeptide (TPR) repeat protein